MKRVPLIAVICLAFLPTRAPAPIFGEFPGLDKLINGADFILVAVIMKRPDMPDMGNGGIFEIEIVRVLKGDTKQGRHTAYLRDLPFTLEPHTARSLTNGFFEDQVYLLFLQKGGTGFRDENNKPLRTDFESENCAADAIWINQQIGRGYDLKELDSLKGKSTRDAIVTLLQHTAKRHREFADAVDAILADQAAK
jgi:hypothetical protein